MNARNGIREGVLTDLSREAVGRTRSGEACGDRCEEEMEPGASHSGLNGDSMFPGNMG